MKKTHFASSLFLVLVLATATVTAQNGLLSAIHAIPGLPEPVDVLVDGEFLLSFDFGESAGPLELPEGDYFLEIQLAGETVLSAVASVVEGENFTAIAHLTNGDDDVAGLKLSLFQNEISPIFSNRARVTIRHTANAPEVSAGLRGGFLGLSSFVLPGLSNDSGGDPSQGGPLDVRNGSYRATLYAGRDPVFDAGVLDLASGVSYIVYAVADFFEGSFDLYIQTIDLELLHSDEVL